MCRGLRVLAQFVWLRRSVEVWRIFYFIKVSLIGSARDLLSMCVYYGLGNMV
jgi:hypothetical protein